MGTGTDSAGTIGAGNKLLSQCSSLAHLIAVGQQTNAL